LSNVETIDFSFCSPSRGPTSTILHEDDSHRLAAFGKQLLDDRISGAVIFILVVIIMVAEATFLMEAMLGGFLIDMNWKEDSFHTGRSLERSRAKRNLIFKAPADDEAVDECRMGFEFANNTSHPHSSSTAVAA
jgi:hypothetical protein